MDRSLGEVHGSVPTNKKGLFKKLFSFMGPAYLVSVGYMDPGNWATDLAGGSQFGYKLIWVLLLSNLMALLLQSLCSRLGVVYKKDLAQASVDLYPKWISFFLYLLAEVAIAATDLAEVLGMAIGLNLLFGLSLEWGITFSLFDTFLILFLMRFGMRKMEAFILAIIAVIGGAFLVELFLAKPEPLDIFRGFIPTIPNKTALYISIGIIGATVMPHNLYLHSALVQSRSFSRDDRSIRRALRFNVIDSAVALNLAFFVNAAILILAAATFFTRGMHNVAEIEDAHKLLAPLLGTKMASTLFAVALIAAGQSSTLTGTLSGQIVMEGYLHIRLQPWLRRLLTRMLAIVPAYLVILLMGKGQTGELLVLSQVVLSLQLGFAVIPLIHLVSDKVRMGKFRLSIPMRILSWVCALIILALNIQLVIEEFRSFSQGAEGGLKIVIWALVFPFILFCAFILLYISFFPKAPVQKKTREKTPLPRLENLEAVSAGYQRIAVAVDFTETDKKSIAQALKLGGKGTEYLLLHITNSAGSYMMGEQIEDRETEEDRRNLEHYRRQLEKDEHCVFVKQGHGELIQGLIRLVKESRADLLIMGAHDHTTIKNLLEGTILDKVRQHIDIPVFIVR